MTLLRSISTYNLPDLCYNLLNIKVSKHLEQNIVIVEVIGPLYSPFKHVFKKVFINMVILLIYGNDLK